jgi:uncharacterized RDD family membrane protein YckC
MTHDNLLDANLVTPERKDAEANLAGTGQRFGNLVIDMIAAYGIMFMVLYAMGKHYTHMSQGSAILYELGTRLGYYFLMEALFGKTLGKFITRTHVVNMDGEKPSFGTILGRTFCRLIPFEAFSFLSGRPGWHDTISGTRVVND